MYKFLKQFETNSIPERQPRKNKKCKLAVAEPDLELRKEEGVALLVLLALLPSVISSFFIQNKGGRSPGPPP